MSQIRITFVRFGDSADVYTATASYAADSDTYFVVTRIEGAGGDDVLTALNMPLVLGGQTVDQGAVLDGGDGNDTLNGSNRNDELVGSIGDDVLHGGDGDDALIDGTGANSLFGGAGDDTLYGTEADAVLDGGAGNDTLIAIGNMASAPSLVGIENLRVSASNNNGNDRLSFTATQLNSFVTVKVMQGPHSGINLATAGTVGTNFTADSGGGFVGSSGADTIDLSSTQRSWSVFAGDDLGGNVLTGGSENDWLNAGQGGDTLNGGAGDDRLDGGEGNDRLNGGVGNDGLVGSIGDDVLHGGDGDDTLIGGTGANSLFGEAGDDTLYGSEADAVLDGGAENDTLIAIGNMASAPSLVGIENLRVSASNNNGNDRLSFTATQLNSFVTVKVMQGPHSGINLATAGTVGTNFTADSGGGFVGSSGADTIDLSSTQRSWSVFAGDDLGGNVLTGGSENDWLNAGQGGDTLNGGAGDDTLNGGSGGDRLDGGAGADAMAGGAGADIYYVDNTADLVTEATSGGLDTVYASANFALGAGQEIETLRVSGAAGLTLTGNGLANDLIGGAGSDTLNGGDGADSLVGGAGADTMDGGEGGDIYRVDASDIIHDTGTTGSDQVIVVGTFTLTPGSGIETLSSKAGTAGGFTLIGDEGDNKVTGNIGNNTLRGLDGNDKLFGGDGNDKLTGGLGRDVMTGGNDADNFIFRNSDSPAGLFDSITDFVTGIDKIDLQSVTGAGLPALSYAEASVASNSFNDILNAATVAMAGGNKSAVFVAGSVHGWLFWNTDANPQTPDEGVRLNFANNISAFQIGDLV
jgi:Ca2+-binding RTX toxin-like protein